MVAILRVAVLVSCVAAVGCKQKNPEFCCTTLEECDRFGVDELIPCGASEVCVASECVAPECETSAQCIAPEPYCVDRVCTAACRDATSCEGIAGLPHCDADGACVECTEEAHCPGQAPVCDPGTRTCVPCSADSECGSGVCLATEGTCAPEPDTVFVSNAGSDTGTCTAVAPCRTIAFALARITAQRRVLRIASLDYTATDGVVIGQDVYLDGNDSRVQRTSAGPVITVNNQAEVTIEGIRIVAPAQSALEVADRAVVIAALLTIQDADDVALTPGVHVVDSTLHLFDSTLEETGLSCEGISFQAGLELRGVTMTIADKSPTISVTTLGCPEHITRSRFQGVTLDLDHAEHRVENNLFIQRNGAGSSIRLTDSLLASTVRFNTLVARSSGGIGLDNQIVCSGTGAPVLTSNVFAAQSTRPLGTTCTARYSLFDDDVGPVPPGMGNALAAHATVFADEPGGNYLPIAASGALGAAEPGLDVTDDFTGAPRPQPAGSTADIGAFEAP